MLSESIRRLRRYPPSVKIALVYGAFGFAWILLFHEALEVLIDDVSLRSLLLGYEDWFYVAVSALLIYGLVDWQTNINRRFKRQLKEREEELRLTFENAPTAIATFGLDGRILSANRRACSMLGYTEPELCALSYDEVIHPEDREDSHRIMEQCVNGQLTTYTFENRYLHKSGATVYGRVHNGIVFGPDGRPSMLVAQVEDLTDRKRAEHEAQENRERLAHVDRVSLLGEMAAGIAHEINQPLTAIANYAEAARRRVQSATADPEKLLSSLEKVAEQAQRAGEVIRRLRSLVKKRVSQREVSDMNDLVRESVKLATADARVRDISIDVELAPELPEVYVDPVQIQQVILNLLRNAVDATEGYSNGERKVGVRTDFIDELVEVSVSDEGVGISAEAADRIFSPFFTTKQSGMGMGLSISRSIINSHGGHLWFDSNAGHGTTFHFTLPLEPVDVHD